MAFSEELKAQLRAAGKSEAEIAAMEATQSSGDKKAGTTRYPTIYSKTKADAEINDFFQKTFDRNATSSELKKWRPLLTQAVKNNPTVQSYDPVTKTQTTLTGLDVDQWLTNQITKDPAYSEELKTIALTPKDVAQKVKDKALYESALAGTAKDAAAIEKLGQSTSYGIAIRSLKNRISAEAVKAGATLDEATLDQIAKEAYDTNQDSDVYTLQKFLDKKFKFEGGSYKGEALDTFRVLRDTAIANGLDINQAFGNQLPAWIKAVNEGANIEEFKQAIRGVAKLGMPQTVANLLDQGVDLDTVYSPYKRLMASVLEISPESISLDDPTLRSAVGPDKEMSLYDFQRQLRQDPRWQYTDNAREEVSNVALRVLKDFGFQG